MSTAPRVINAYAALEPSSKLVPFKYESRRLGPEDVEVKISHCGICGSIPQYVDNTFGFIEFPFVGGHEIAGEVTATGSDVTDLVIGDRVGVSPQVWACLNRDPAKPCKACAEGDTEKCPRSVSIATKYEDGAPAHGGFADYIRVDSNFAFKIPDNVPSTTAAPLMSAGLTVYSPLKRYVKPGDRVGVIGIGGLGHLAIQFIRALDAIPVAFSRSANKEKEVLALGAEEFYDLSDPESQKKADSSVDVLLLTAYGADMPYDMYLSLVKNFGTFIMVGSPEGTATFHPTLLMGKGISWVGSLIGSLQDTKDMLELTSKKGIRAIVQELSMSQVNEGLTMTREGRARYRVVLKN